MKRSMSKPYDLKRDALVVSRITAPPVDREYLYWLQLYCNSKNGDSN